MAAIIVLVSGWIGLAFAVIGQIATDATYTQFFTTLLQVGIITLLLNGAAIAIRQMTSHLSARHA
jgi:hypothetical protein